VLPLIQAHYKYDPAPVLLPGEVQKFN